MGVNKGQGYLYGRPMNASNARRLLAERRLLRPAQQKPATDATTDAQRKAS